MIGPTNFRYCPFCGSDGVIEHDVKAVRCQTCGMVYYHNVASAAAALIETDQGIVLVRRSHAPHEGTLDLPGGFLDYGESYEDAVRREVFEETGLKIQGLRYFCSFPNQYSYRNVSYFTADIVFLCRVESMDGMRGDHEVSEILLIPSDQINPSEIAIESMRKAVELYLQSCSKQH